MQIVDSYRIPARRSCLAGVVRPTDPQTQRGEHRLFLVPKTDGDFIDIDATTTALEEKNNSRAESSVAHAC
ncbi:hypothetical protein GGD63_005358 [Bradyrhizobium sp. cir1]|uniref:hypothetical protein n=1 Tax=Bradyrhizobium sp. cir1 TaxID=1445730 RepID=UPI0016061AF2|nr:hypothetical protein [Bradyrhizobium sp. cir1]MBB4372550.1 hypothetical protein [Bradyrhizobium sp. cir1]